MTTLYGMPYFLKEKSELCCLLLTVKISSMAKNFLLLYDLNKSSQYSRPCSLILKNHRICNSSQIFVNTFFLESVETSGNKTTSVFWVENSLTFVEFVSRWAFRFVTKKSVNLKLKVRVEHIMLETMMNDLKLCRWSGKCSEGNYFLSNTTHVYSRRQVDFKTGQQKSWTGARRLLYMNVFSTAHAGDVISKRTPSRV